MPTKEDFEAVAARITEAQGDTRVQIVAVTELIRSLREDLRNGGTISESDLDQLLQVFSAKADEAESIREELDKADDEEPQE